MDFPGLFSDHILTDHIHKINLSFIVNNFAKKRGGTAGNVSYSLTLLKTPHILFSTAGKDFDEYKKAFIKLGVSLKHVKVFKDIYTATGLVMTDKADNQIWAYSYGATDFVHTLKLKPIAKKTDMVLIGPQGAKGSLSFVKQCIDLHIPYMFDPGFILTHVSNEDLELGISHASYITGNDYELSVIKERIKKFSEITKNAIIITTFGEKGAVIENKSEKIFIKSAKPEHLVDPTGAGDAWRAGFLAGIEKGYGLQTCGQMGAVTASFAIEKYGTQEHRFTKQQFTKRYLTTYNEKLVL